MLAKVICIPCYFRQALSSAEYVTSDPEKQRSVLHEVAKLIPRLSLEDTPAHNSTIVLRAANRILGVDDPYLEEKTKYNELALELYPRLVQIVKESPNPLETASRLSVVGNVIDLGIRAEINIEATIKQVLTGGFKIDHVSRLLKILGKPRHVLYVVDNAGEIVFDKLFIEKLIEAGHKVTVAVKSGPILNDATMEDARQVGLSDITEIVETGSDWVGVDLPTCSKQFQKLFVTADVVISKGQGNFETIGGSRPNLFIVLKAKCDAVAKEIGVNFGDLVFLQED